MRAQRRTWILKGAWLVLSVRFLAGMSWGVAEFLLLAETQPNASGLLQSATPKVRSLAGAEVVRLIEAGADVAIIKTQITNSLYLFNPTTDEIIALKGRGVPAEIITTLIQHATELQAEAANAATDYADDDFDDSGLEAFSWSYTDLFLNGAELSRSDGYAWYAWGFAWALVWAPSCIETCNHGQCHQCHRHPTAINAFGPRYRAPFGIHPAFSLPSHPPAMRETHGWFGQAARAARDPQPKSQNTQKTPAGRTGEVPQPGDANTAAVPAIHVH